MAVLFTDSGVGTDASPIGGNWTTITGEADFQRLTNQIRGTGSGDCGAYVNSVTPPANQYMQIAIQSTGGGADDGGPRVRVNPANGDCYVLDTDGSTISLFWFHGGTHTAIGSGFSYTLTPGDIHRVQAIGSSITGWLNGVKVCTAVDTNISSGNFGVFGHTSGFICTLAEGGFFLPSSIWRQDRTSHRPGPFKPGIAR